ncbi:hypothetical protein QFZ84_005781 [Pseudomonas fluorescens]
MGQLHFFYLDGQFKELDNGLLSLRYVGPITASLLAVEMGNASSRCIPGS